MTSRKLLAEIKELRLEGREHQRRADELIDEIREEVRLTREEVQLTREEVQLTREEIRLNREVIRRNELAFRQGATALGELIGEIRAQTQAIFKLIDRLDGGAATA
ncbi:MAG: hypothetical protein AABM66_14760 [Actinomycetota bacterium]